MLRLAALLAAVPFLAPSAAAAGGSTALRIAVWPDGPRVAEVHRYTLACTPARGTVPRPARACTALARPGPAAFARVPRLTVCTEIYGGPAEARVRGVVAGRRVDARLSLRNGCEIGRWNRVRSVVPRR